MSRISRVCFLAYTMVSFVGSATMLRGCDNMTPVFAQSRQQDYELNRHLDDNTREVVTIREKQAQIERHLEAHDTRIDDLNSKVSDLNSKVSFIQGGGAIILAGLGVLNMLGLLTRRPLLKEKNE